MLSGLAGACAVLGTMGLALAFMATLLERDPKGKCLWLADRETCPEKRGWERFALLYSIFWQLCFAAIIGFKMFLWFDSYWYMGVCGGLCIPLFVYPLLNVENRPMSERFSIKATVWIAVFSHIGNYWYTHYFYTVLKARYTFPSWRLNNVPFCLYFATYFYFATYHTLANCAIRKVYTTYAPTVQRGVFLAGLVLFMSYLVAMMETLTISGFPYYDFEDRDMVYSLGSFFYGIYFIVSFPMFFIVDEDPRAPYSLFQTFFESLGSSMLVLCMLDAVRLCLGIPFVMSVADT